MMTVVDNGTTEAPEEVLDLLREQAALYVRLETMAARQQSLVTVEDAGPLLALLADRQKLSDGLTHIAARLAPVRRDWAVYRQHLSRPQQGEADRLWEVVQRSLRRIIEGDEQDAMILSARKQTVAQALRTTHSTSQAILAYRGPFSGASRMDCVDEVSK